MNNNFNIEQLLNLDNYATDERSDRRKGSGSTQEFFTPYSIVKKMCDKIPESDWSNPDKTFLEPCFGNGQFLLYIIYNRIQHGIDYKTTLETLYGVELMTDNVIEAKERIISLLEEISPGFDKSLAQQIMDKNLVCSDFFKWDFENWKPIPEYKSTELF